MILNSSARIGMVLSSIPVIFYETACIKGIIDEKLLPPQEKEKKWQEVNREENCNLEDRRRGCFGDDG